MESFGGGEIYLPVKLAEPGGTPTTAAAPGAARTALAEPKEVVVETAASAAEVYVDVPAAARSLMRPGHSATSERSGGSGFSEDVEPDAPSRVRYTCSCVAVWLLMSTTIIGSFLLIYVLCSWLAMGEPPLPYLVQQRCPDCASFAANVTAELRAFVLAHPDTEQNDYVSVVGHMFRSSTKLDFSEGKYGGLVRLAQNSSLVGSRRDGFFPEVLSVASAPVVSFCGIQMLLVWQHDSTLLQLLASFFIANGIGAFAFPVSYTHLTLPTICSV